MSSRGKMMVELALKKARQQQCDQTVAVKGDKRVQKDIVPGLAMSVNMPVSVTVAETVSTMSSRSDESRHVQAVVMTDDVTDMPAVNNQDPETAVDEGPGSGIDETHATPAAATDKCPENDDDRHGDEEMNEVPHLPQNVATPKRYTFLANTHTHLLNPLLHEYSCKTLPTMNI